MEILSKFFNKKPSTKSQKKASLTQDIQYLEIISSPVWVRASVYGFFSVLIIFFLFFPLWSQEPDSPTNLLLCIVFALSLLAFVNFFSLRIALYKEKIQFGYYLFSKQFEYLNIKSCETVQFQSSDFFSIGPKEGPDNAMCYTVPGSPHYGVKLVVQEEDYENVYLFSSKRPEVISKKLQAKIPKEEPAVLGQKDRVDPLSQRLIS